MTEVDAMVCNACGQEERASEGYPCDDCGNFLCIICQFRGVSRCNDCEAKAQAAAEAKSEEAAETPESAEGDPASSTAPGDAGATPPDDPIDD